MRCQEIASPSRSGSVARYTAVALSAAPLISFIMAFFPLGITYWGVKPLFTSTPRVFCGKSRTCPIDALMAYWDPMILPKVFALAGDSTITSFVLAIFFQQFRRVRSSCRPIVLPILSVPVLPEYRSRWPQEDHCNDKDHQHESLLWRDD